MSIEDKTYAEITNRLMDVVKRTLEKHGRGLDAAVFNDLQSEFQKELIRLDDEDIPY